MSNRTTYPEYAYILHAMILGLEYTLHDSLLSDPRYPLLLLLFTSLLTQLGLTIPQCTSYVITYGMLDYL